VAARSPSAAAVMAMVAVESKARAAQGKLQPKVQQNVFRASAENRPRPLTCRDLLCCQSLKCLDSLSPCA
jgi:hypothetical protein